MIIEKLYRSLDRGKTYREVQKDPMIKADLKLLYHLITDMRLNRRVIYKYQMIRRTRKASGTLNEVIKEYVIHGYLQETEQ